MGRESRVRELGIAKYSGKGRCDMCAKHARKAAEWDATTLLPTRPEWMLSAPCASADPEIWYDHLTVVTAKAICDTCPFKSPCVTYAITHGEIWGVWGGLSAPQRVGMTEAGLFLEAA
jgi:WhiB family redox-sensing transcriptional regulator